MAERSKKSRNIIGIVLVAAAAWESGRWEDTIKYADEKALSEARYGCEGRGHTGVRLG